MLAAPNLTSSGRGGGYYQSRVCEAWGDNWQNLAGLTPLFLPAPEIAS